MSDNIISIVCPQGTFDIEFHGLCKCGGEFHGLCKCGGEFQGGTVRETGKGRLTHTLPFCDDFAQLEPDVYMATMRDLSGLLN